MDARVSAREFIEVDFDDRHFRVLEHLQRSWRTRRS